MPPTTTDTFVVLVSPVQTPPETWLNQSNEVRRARSKASISSQQENEQKRKKEKKGANVQHEKREWREGRK